MKLRISHVAFLSQHCNPVEEGFKLGSVCYPKVLRRLHRDELQLKYIVKMSLQYESKVISLASGVGICHL